MKLSAQLLVFCCALPSAASRLLPPGSTHNFVTHHLVTPNSFTHKIVPHISFTNNFVTHTHNFVTHNSFTHNSLGDIHAACVASVALGDIEADFVWQAWHLVTSTSLSVWQTWHLATSTSLRRLCVASVALSDIDVTSVHLPSSTLARNSFTHDSFTHSIFTYNSFNYRSSTISFVFPASPVQLQPRFVIFWRD